MSKVRIESDPPEGKYLTLQEIQIFWGKVRTVTGGPVGSQFDTVPHVVTNWQGKPKTISVEVNV
jgi:hypothetical protein